MCVCECACFVLCFSCLRSAAVSLQGNLTFNCCVEVALPDVPVLMRREDEETAVLLLSIGSPMQRVPHSAENLTLYSSLLW